jgi:hypothetical protein
MTQKKTVTSGTLLSIRRAVEPVALREEIVVFMDRRVGHDR